MDPVEAVLGPGCIVYAYTSSSMPPHRSNYSGRIHVDSPRVIPGYMTNLGDHDRAGRLHRRQRRNVLPAPFAIAYSILRRRKSSWPVRRG